jgi:hypothetical protein
VELLEALGLLEALWAANIDDRIRSVIQTLHQDLIGIDRDDGRHRRKP